jgi:hypothetical protein
MRSSFTSQARVRHALVWVAGIAIWAPSLRAQDAGAPPADDAPVVVLLVDRRGDPDPHPIIKAVRAQVSDLAVQLEVHWASPPVDDLPRQAWMAQQIAHASDAAMVIWLAPLSGDRLYVLVPASTDQPLLERHLGEPDAGGSSEVTAIIARNAIRAWLVGAPIEAEPVDVEPAPPEPTPAAAPVSPPPPGPPRDAPTAAPRIEDQPWGGRVSVDVAYDYQALGADHPAVHGAAFALSVWVVSGVRVLTGYRAIGSLDGTESGFRLALQRHPLLLGLRWNHPVGPVEIGAGLIGELDIVDEQLNLIPASGVEVGSRREIDILLHPFARLDWPLVGWLRLFICAGPEIALSRTEYSVEVDGSKRTIISTWPVRPLINAGLAVGFL